MDLYINNNFENMEQDRERYWSTKVNVGKGGVVKIKIFCRGVTLKGGEYGNNSDFPVSGGGAPEKRRDHFRGWLIPVSTQNRVNIS